MPKHLPKSSITGADFPAIPDAVASTRLALQYQLEHSQWWRPEQLREQQFAQLACVLRHAVETVPYYRQLFQQHGIVVPEQITEAFMRVIPISRRDMIQQAGDQLESQRPLTVHGEQHFSVTSGSTGRPVRFARNGLTQEMWLAFALRDHLWHERDFRTKLGAIRWYPRGTAEAPEGDRSPDWGSIVAPVFASGPSVSLNVVADLEQQMQWLQRERPDYLVSFASNLVALSRYAKSRNLPLPSVRELRTVGETVSDEMRGMLEVAWNAKLNDVYTCEEAGYLALQCPQSGHYHVQSENVILEIVDEDGKPCAPGKPGQVLVTTLHNYATPLIRYEVGDIAEFGEPCSCGRGLPVIRRILGRKRNRLVLPDGQSVFPYMGEHDEITKLTGVMLYQFQCIQHSLEELELKLVMDRHLTADEQARVAAGLNAHLGHSFRVRFSFLEAIPGGPNGKFEEFVSKLA